MDMKSKGIRWVESIYQTFETVCDDVDSAINQAPMNFVGNPVLTAGKGVKKFCSSVIQDLLPPLSSGNNEICKVSPEENAHIVGFIDLKNIEGNEFYMDGEPVEVDGAAKSINQGTVNYVQSSSPVKRQESNVNETRAVCNSFDTGIHAVNTQLQDAVSQMNVSCHSAVTELTSSLKDEKPHPDTYHEYEHIETSCDVSGRSLSPDAVFRMEASCNSAITELTSSQLAEKPDSDPYHEYEHIETPSDGSDGSLTFESAKVKVKLSTDISEDVLLNSTKSQSVSDLSSPTNVTVSETVGKSEQKESFPLAYSSKLFAISSNSYDVDPLRVVSESETLSCSSGSLAEHGWGASTLESSMFSDICISDDLSESEPLAAEVFSVDDIKLLRPDLFTNTHSHFSSSHRRPSLKSYKKLLKDTLSSKKRLAKEYKQLGIWHGDIHEEHEFATSTKPSIPPTAQPSSTTVINSTSQNLSEWELL